MYGWEARPAAFQIIIKRKVEKWWCLAGAAGVRGIPAATALHSTVQAASLDTSHWPSREARERVARRNLLKVPVDAERYHHHQKG